MGVSSNKEVRIRQQEVAQAKVNARQELLKERGITEKKALDKDPVLRKLKAGLQKATGRLAALEARAQHVAKVLEDKKKKGKAKAQSGKTGKSKKGQAAAAGPAKKKQKKGK